MVQPTKADPAHKYSVEEFDDFLRSSKGRNGLYELVNGNIIDKSLTEEQGLILSNIGAVIHGYARKNRSGRVGFAVQYAIPTDSWNVRLPAIAYSTTRRPLVTEGSVPAMPELAIEVQSPDDTVKAMREKATYYLANGAQVVWLIYPRKRVVEVYYANGEIDIFREGETLSGETLLPGFSLPVTDIFADPFAD